jgi:hypothetical protein
MVCKAAQNFADWAETWNKREPDTVDLAEIFSIHFWLGREEFECKL